MRKTLVFILSLVLAVGFSATSFAMHGQYDGFQYTPGEVVAPASDIHLSGSIRIRGDFKNNTDFDDDSGDSNSSFNQRVRLKVEATVSPGTKGVIELENSSDSSCNYSGVDIDSSYLRISADCGNDPGSNSSDGYNWGTHHGAQGSSNLGNAKLGDVRIRQAYISHQGTDLTGVLSGFKAGHLLVNQGNGLFWNHSQFGDDGVVFFIQPNKNTELTLSYLKLYEGDGSESDDTNVWILGAEAMAGGANLAADFTYLDSQNAMDIFGGLIDDGIHFYNLSLRADTEVEGIKLYGDLELQGGAIESTILSDDIDFEGYAWMIGANAAIPDSPVTVNGEIAYGSGQPLDDDVLAGDSIGQFMNTQSAGSGMPTFIYNNTVKTAAGYTSAGVQNTWYVNLGASFKASPDITVGAEYYYLAASEDVMNDEGKETDDIGSEIDGIFKWQLDTNLLYYIEGGILFAGDMYNKSDDEADNPYRIRNGLVLSF